MGAGERDSLVFVPLHLCMPAIVFCLFQQHPEVLIFLLKRGEESLWGTVPCPLGCLRSHGIRVCVETLRLWVLATPSNTQINILLSFPETSAHWTKSPSTGRSPLKASSWTLAAGFSFASFLRVNYSSIMSSNKSTTFGSNNNYWLQEGGPLTQGAQRGTKAL